METLTYPQILFIGAIIAVAVYFFSQSRSKSFWIKELEQELKVRRKELQDWQNKALIKHGSSPLTKQPFKASKAKTQEITPKVITRQQLEYREADPMQTPINIHATEVSYQRVAGTVEKAAEIIAAHR
jgi:hypothetical protein